MPAIVVTGSHIPFDRNGIKFYRVQGEISKADEQAITSAQVELPARIIATKLPDPDEQALNAYVQRYVDFFGAGSLFGMRVVLYEHSSVARDIFRQLLTLLGVEVISVGRVDSFVPIDTEAVRDEDIAQAKAWSQQYEFDAILSTDGDADRPLISDENGQWFRGDAVGLLCAAFLNADSVVTPISSNSAVESCHKFRKVIRTRIGSPYVIAAMDNELVDSNHSVVGYEANGGVLLGSDVTRNGKLLSALPTRDAVLPMLAMLMMAKEAGCKLSELAHGLPERYTASNRLQNFLPEKSKALLETLALNMVLAAQLLAPASGEIDSVNTLDGFRATFANGDIVHLRASGNAPELRCYAESDTAESAQLLSNAALQSIALEH
jgi:phosphomannomutase